MLTKNITINKDKLQLTTLSIKDIYNNSLFGLFLNTLFLMLIMLVSFISLIILAIKLVIKLVVKLYNYLLKAMND